MSAVDQEIVDRDRLAVELVEHLVLEQRDTCAELPVCHVDAAGRLSLWKVTVERVEKLDFGAE